LCTEFPSFAKIFTYSTFDTQCKRNVHKQRYSAKTHKSRTYPQRNACVYLSIHKVHHTSKGQSSKNISQYFASLPLIVSLIQSRAKRLPALVQRGSAVQKYSGTAALCANTTIANPVALCANTTSADLSRANPVALCANTTCANPVALCANTTRANTTRANPVALCATTTSANSVALCANTTSANTTSAPDLTLAYIIIPFAMPKLGCNGLSLIKTAFQ
jgi:hypothetical protein